MESGKIMNRVALLFALLVLLACIDAYADDLPLCTNRVINEVTKRSGCTVGDPKCWFAKGGFCMDYVQKMTARRQTSKSGPEQQIRPELVRKGDTAQFFTPRAHYAFVESVLRDKQGSPV